MGLLCFSTDVIQPHSMHFPLQACKYFANEQKKIERKIEAVEEDAGGSKEELQHQRDLVSAETLHQSCTQCSTSPRL